MASELALEETKSVLTDTHPANRVDLDRELIKRIAKDVGEAVQLHILTMYPAAVEAATSTFLLSVRNTVINEIMAATAENDIDRIEARLKDRKDHRRSIKVSWSKLRGAQFDSAD